MLWQRGKAYAQYLRERVFAASGAGLPVGRIAEAVFVSISNVSKVLGRRRDAGETLENFHIHRRLARGRLGRTRGL